MPLRPHFHRTALAFALLIGALSAPRLSMATAQTLVAPTAGFSVSIDLDHFLISAPGRGTQPGHPFDSATIQDGALVLTSNLYSGAYAGGPDTSHASYYRSLQLFEPTFSFSPLGNQTIVGFDIVYQGHYSLQGEDDGYAAPSVSFSASGLSASFKRSSFNDSGSFSLTGHLDGATIEPYPPYAFSAGVSTQAGPFSCGFSGCAARSATMSLNSITITPVMAVPEPASLALILMGGMFGLGVRLHRTSARRSDQG